MNVFLKLGLLLVFSLVGARIAKKFHLPNVTGYLIGGLFLGPSFFNVITKSDGAMVTFVNEIALAAIAFNIGGEFLLKDFKRLGKEVFIITIFEVIGVVLLVFGVMYFIFNQHFVFSLIVASMSAATAPAGTMMVISQYRAKGSLTDTILPVAALDDALGIMVFGLALSASKINMGHSDFSIGMVILPFVEIILSLGLGVMVGFALSKMSYLTKNEEELLGLILVFVLINVGLSKYFGLSPLLSAMMIGAVFINTSKYPTRVFTTLNQFTIPFNILFFALAGASLNLSVLAQIGFLGLGYVFARFFGKVLGAHVGARLAKSPLKIQKYLGLALLPQGGISIGLSMIVSQELPKFSGTIIPLILFSVLVFEISGPILAKFALTKANEI